MEWWRGPRDEEESLCLEPTVVYRWAPRNSICNNDKSKPKQGRVRPKPTKRKDARNEGNGMKREDPETCQQQQQLGTSSNIKQAKHQNTNKKKKKTPNSTETETGKPSTENATPAEIPHRGKPRKKNCARKKELTERERQKREAQKRLHMEKKEQRWAIWRSDYERRI